MPPLFTAGTASAPPGSKARGVIPVPGLDVAIPVMIINGVDAGPVLCVTAGIHGAEYVGIDAAIRAADGLDPGSLRGTVVVVPVANPPAFAARSIYVCPLDGKNLNRVFPGNPDGSASERMAHALFTHVIRRASAYIDLHGGDLNEALMPFTLFYNGARPDVLTRSRAMAEAFGLGYAIEGSVKGSTVEAASFAGIPAILPEAGGQGILDEAMVALHLRGMRNVLSMLGMTSQAPEPVAAPVRISAFVWMRSEHAGLFYPTVSVGARVALGTRVGEIRDWYGAPLAPVHSPATGVILFLVTTPATNPGDPLFAIGVAAAPP